MLLNLATLCLVKNRVALPGKIGVYFGTNRFGLQTFAAKNGSCKLLTR